MLAVELAAKEPSLLLPPNADSSPAERLLPNETTHPALTNEQDNDLPF